MKTYEGVYSIIHVVHDRILLEKENGGLSGKLLEIVPDGHEQYPGLKINELKSK